MKKITLENKIIFITGVAGFIGSNGTDLRSSYEWGKSSQFNYFMVKMNSHIHKILIKYWKIIEI